LVLSGLKERKQFVEHGASGVINFRFGRLAVGANHWIAKFIRGIVSNFIKNLLGLILISRIYLKLHTAQSSTDQRVGIYGVSSFKNTGIPSASSLPLITMASAGNSNEPSV